MNLVQSFWTAPLHYHESYANEPFRGGWLSEKHHAISWLFSQLQLRKCYPGATISLYTDKAGASWLIDRLGLAYNEVKTELDILNSYPPVFWALGKVYTYSRQTEPFIHLDGDVYLWAPLPAKPEAGRLLVQSLEIDYKDYRVTLNDSKTAGINLPACLQKLLSEQASVIAANFGVIGSADLELIQDYCRTAFQFINENRQQIIASPEGGNYNLVFEQLLLTQMAMDRYGSGKGLAPLLDAQFSNLAGVTRFGLVPQEVKYVHMLGQAKAWGQYVSQIEGRFAYEYPAAYKHIQQLYPEPPAYYFLNGRSDGWRGQCPDFSQRPPFQACRLQLAQLQPDAPADADIEDILAEHFDDPAYNRLWDIYQIESFHPGPEKLLSYITDMRLLPLLYETDMDSFLQLSFQLNDEVCRLAYFYHDWQGGLYFNNLDDFATGRHHIPYSNNGELQPWLLVQSTENLHFYRPVGWHAIMRYLEEGPVTGMAIVAAMQADPQFVLETQTLKEDVYAFLSSQLHFSHTICLAGETNLVNTLHHTHKEQPCC